MGPTAKDVLAVYLGVRRLRLTNCAGVTITLQSYRVAIRRLPIHAEAALPFTPAIGRIGPGREQCVVAIEILSVDFEIQIRRKLRSITKAAEVLELSAAATLDVDTLRFPGALGDDVDNSINGICAPLCSPWPANHLDTINVLQQSILHVPKNSGVERRIDCPSIYHDEQFVRNGRIESAGADRPRA